MNDLGLRIKVRPDPARENVTEVILEHIDASGGARLVQRLSGHPANAWGRKRAIETGRLQAGLRGFDFVIEG
jgi:hypothetical protein